MSPAVAAKAEPSDDAWEVTTGALPVNERTLTCADLEAELDARPDELSEPTLAATAEALCATL